MSTVYLPLLAGRPLHGPGAHSQQFTCVV